MLEGNEQADKFERIYNVLTKDEIDAWRTSHDRVPRPGITSAFRNAERRLTESSCNEMDIDAADGKMDDFDDVAFPYLTELFSELAWRVVAGSLPVAHAVAYLRSDKPFEKILPGDTVGAAGVDGGIAGSKVGEDEWKVDPIVECLCDTIWGVDSMLRGTVLTGKLDALEGKKEWPRLCEFVRELRNKGVVPEIVLLAMLTEEILVGSGIIGKPTVLRNKSNTQLGRLMLKKNTDMVYKQQRFNLQREETEGFAKLMVLLGGVQETNVVQSEENMQRLIGYFDLDPNRSLDLTLDALELEPSNRGLLRLVGKFKQETVSHVLSFKLGHYRDTFVAKVHRARVREALNKKEINAARYEREVDKVTPRSLHVLCAVLLSTGMLTLDGLLPHLSPALVSLAAAEKEYMADLEGQLNRAGTKVVKLDGDGNLSLSSGSSSDPVNKLGSMAPLTTESSYSSGGPGFHGRDRERESRDRESARRRPSESSSRVSNAGVKANGSGGDSSAKSPGDEEDPPGVARKDNQLFGLLEALLDLRAWKVASEVLVMLSKEGIDCLRNASVRDALKRLVQEVVDGLAGSCPAPKLLPPGPRKAPPPAAVTPVPVETLVEEAEAGEVIPQEMVSKAPSSQGSPTAAANVSGVSEHDVASSPSFSGSELRDLQQLPGYGNGFARTYKLSEAVSVLGPLLKVLGPHLGRDPVMFARVCRLLSAVAAPNPRLESKTKEKQGGGGSSSSGSSNHAASGSKSGKDKSSDDASEELAKLRSNHPLLKAPCLFGMRELEAKEFCDRLEVEGGGTEVVAAALKKELDRRKSAYIRVVLSVAPCLGMTHGNPAMQGEVWAMLSGLPYQDRFLLYGAWRGHSMERTALGSKHPQLVVAEMASGSEIGRQIKMVTSDNMKEMARKLGKSSHAHPILFAEKVLNQLESYDNFINLLADCIRFVSNGLGLDCIAYTLVQHLCQTSRRIVSESGLTLERWVTNLAIFSGLLYRKHPETDVKPVLCWAVRALAEGGEAGMAAGKMLREVLDKAGGVQVLDGWSITQAQVDGKGGGDVLKQENASFGASVRAATKTRRIIQDGMEKAGASLPLVVLPAHQAEALLYQGGGMDDLMRGKPQPHLKVLGHRSDETHTTMLQVIEFLWSAKDWVETTCPSLGTLMKVYKLEPRVAFHLWRPVINMNLMRHWFGKQMKKATPESVKAADRFIATLEKDVASLIPGASPLKPKLLIIFWALSLRDVYVPTKRYTAVQHNVGDAKKRAESKLHDDKQAAGIMENVDNPVEVERLTKAERAQYEADINRCEPTYKALEKEKAEQTAHVKRIKNKLREIKDELFEDNQPLPRAENVHAVLKHLVGPRVGMGPEEAYFCSKFFHTLHAIETPSFNSLLFCEKSFSCLVPTLLCKTEYEAASIGFFLKDLLEDVKEWREPGNEAIFRMEAGAKHGFNLRATEAGGGTSGSSKSRQMPQKDFIQASGEWSIQLTKTLLAAIDSKEFLLIKCGLITLSKIVETFPMTHSEGRKLLEHLEPMTDKSKEQRDDIRVPCTAIVIQLKKKIPETPPEVEVVRPPSSAQRSSKTSTGSGGTGGGGSGGGGGGGGGSVQSGHSQGASKSNGSTGSATGANAPSGSGGSSTVGRTVGGLNRGSGTRTTSAGAAGAAGGGGNGGSGVANVNTASSSEAKTKGKGGLSSSASPFVPSGSKAASSGTTSSSRASGTGSSGVASGAQGGGGSSNVKRSHQPSQASSSQQASSSGSSAVAKEPATASGAKNVAASGGRAAPAAAAASAASSTGSSGSSQGQSQSQSQGQGQSGGSGGQSVTPASKRGREASSTNASPAVDRPHKTSRVDSKGEGSAGAASAASSSSAGAQENKDKRTAAPSKDTKALQRTSSGGATARAGPASSTAGNGTFGTLSPASVSAASSRPAAASRGPIREAEAGSGGHNAPAGGSRNVPTARGRDDMRQQPQQQQTPGRSSGPGVGGPGTTRGRAQRSASGGGGGGGEGVSDGGMEGRGLGSPPGRESGAVRDGPPGRDTTPTTTPRDSRERERESRDRTPRGGDAESRAKAMAAKDMERQGPRQHESGGDFRGTGSFTARPSRDTRDAHVSSRSGGGVVRMSSGHGSLSEQDLGVRDRRGSREEVMRGAGVGGGGGVGGMGVGNRGNGREGGGGVYVEDDGRGGGMRGPRGDVGGSVDSRRGGRAVERGSGGGMSRGKRGRSVDPERLGDMSYDIEDEGDPSQAFDSKRMRQQELPPGAEDPPRSSSGRYSPVDDVHTRWRDEGRRGPGGGGGGRMGMTLRDQHMDRGPYDSRGLGAMSSGSRGGRSGMMHMDGGGVGGFMDQGYHDSRSSVLSDEDDGRGSKKGRHDRDRSSSSRTRDDLDGTGRKEKKKSSRKKGSKDKRKN